MEHPILIIGLTGTNGSGKGSVAASLKEAGFAYHSLSDVLREELSRRGMTETVDRLAVLGNELRRSHGPQVLAERILQAIQEARETRAIADSIRNASEVSLFREKSRFVFVAVDAPVELRYERVFGRNRPGDRVTLEQFIAQEQRQLSGGEEEQHLLRCMDLADVRIWNDGDEQDLKRQVARVLDTLPRTPSA